MLKDRTQFKRKISVQEALLIELQESPELEDFKKRLIKAKIINENVDCK